MFTHALDDVIRASGDVDRLRGALTSIVEFVNAVENHEYADPLTIAATIRHKIYGNLVDD